MSCLHLLQLKTRLRPLFHFLHSSRLDQEMISTSMGGIYKHVHTHLHSQRQIAPLCALLFLAVTFIIMPYLCNYSAAGVDHDFKIQSKSPSEEMGKKMENKCKAFKKSSWMSFSVAVCAQASRCSASGCTCMCARACACLHFCCYYRSGPGTTV